MVKEELFLEMEICLTVILRMGNLSIRVFTIFLMKGNIFLVYFNKIKL
jgi:hypothetical protein